VGRLEVDISKCTGCRRCETTCSFYHTGKVSNRLARIKIIHQYLTGIDGPVVCQQCTERYCMVCPVGALSIGPLGQVIVSPTVCTLCGSCAQRCPIGAIEIHENIVYVCDLCGGKPRCVEACTERAITFNPEAILPSLKDITERTSKMNPSEKRFHYIEVLGEGLRAVWRECHD
jgi:carbon-monoxide dehydrogenase iron sulfur subunit